MNRLFGTRSYLCGAMDRAPDAGVAWRQYLRHELSDLGIVWLDPTRKPIDIGDESDGARRLRREAKRIGDWDYVAEKMRPIRAVDLRMVNICDWMPVNINLDIHACGTYHECALANSEKKPILVHVEQGKRHAPDWLFSYIPHQHIFDDWDEMIGYIRHIAHDAVIDRMRRWFFFDFMGEK